MDLESSLEAGKYSRKFSFSRLTADEKKVLRSHGISHAGVGSGHSHSPARPAVKAVLSARRAVKAVAKGHFKDAKHDLQVAKTEEKRVRALKRSPVALKHKATKAISATKKAIKSIDNRKKFKSPTTMTRSKTKAAERAADRLAQAAIHSTTGILVGNKTRHRRDSMSSSSSSSPVKSVVKTGVRTVSAVRRTAGTVVRGAEDVVLSALGKRRRY